MELLALYLSVGGLLAFAAIPGAAAEVRAEYGDGDAVMFVISVGILLLTWPFMLLFPED